MGEEIKDILKLPSQIESILIDSLYNLSADDGGKNNIEIKDEWELKKFMEAGLLCFPSDHNLQEINYPYSMVIHIVTSQDIALNMDSIGESYNATKNSKSVLNEYQKLSTVDAIYITGKEWYFIEFKNGDWDYKDIEKKVYATQHILGDLSVIDNDAVITSNRSSKKYNIKQLKLFQKLKEKFGFEPINDFYKQRAHLMIVYSGKDNILKKLSKLCKRKNEFQDMHKTLQKYLNISKFEKVPMVKVDFGYSKVNEWIAYLLNTKSTNNYLGIFENIEKMYDRIREINNGNSKLVKKLKQLPEKSELIVQMLAEIKVENGGMVNEEEFARILAAESVYPAKYRWGDNNKDIYDKLSELLDLLKCDNFDELNRMSEQVNEISRCLYGNNNKKMLFPLKLTPKNINEFLFNVNEKEDMIGKIILVQRLMKKKQSMDIQAEQKKQLLVNILKMEEYEAGQVADATELNMPLFFAFIAQWAYCNDKYTFKGDSNEEVYYHVIRQINNLSELNKKRQDEKYGKFGKYIDYRVKNNPTCTLESELKRINKEILLGNDLKEMYPMEIAVIKLIPDDDIRIRKLKNTFQGSLLKSVKGCKSVDFKEEIEKVGKFTKREDVCICSEDAYN